MVISPDHEILPIASNHNALQHGPRPLPLFLQIAQHELAGDSAKLQKLLAALQLYQISPRAGTPVPREIMRHGKVRLLAPAHMFSGMDAVPQRRRGTLVFVPSPINPPHVMDIDDERSLAAWLAAKGWTVGLVDWGKVLPEHERDNMDSYVRDYLIPLVARCEEPVHLIGYCLGGMIAMAAACLHPVQSLTLIATPWDFDGYAQERRIEMTGIWQGQESACIAMGLVPMEVMQMGFWSLSPQKLMQKYLDFGAMERDSGAFARFIRMEDWANGGEALPLALGRQLFADFYGRNQSGEGDWWIRDQRIAPETVPCPVLEFASSTDAIVPLTTSAVFANRVIVDTGHVGMIVGSKARSTLWGPIADWLAQH